MRRVSLASSVVRVARRTKSTTSSWSFLGDEQQHDGNETRDTCTQCGFVPFSHRVRIGKAAPCNALLLHCTGTS